MDERKNNTFVRLLLIGLIGFIIWIIVYSLLYIEPSGSIYAGIITLVTLLLIIIFSESFDNFSIAKIFSMSRKLEEKDKAIKNITHENIELRTNLMNMITSVSQKQSSTNIIGLPDNIAKQIIVEQASEDEIKQFKEDDKLSDTSQPSGSVRKRIDHQKLEEIVFSKFLSQFNLSEYNLIKEAKLVTQFSGIDAISNIQPIYDGYINTGKDEIFIEIQVSRGRGISIMLKERFYLLLNKIYLYNTVKNANAKLNLIFVFLEEDKKISNNQVDRIKEYFEPAIIKGILRIIEIKLDANETKEVLNNVY